MKLHAHLRNLCSDETGQDLVEYALVAGLIGLGAVLSVKTVTNSVANVFGALGTTIASTS